MMELGKHYAIDAIVPHVGFMSLLDELIGYDAERITVAVTIRENSEFYVPERGVPAWVGLEYMAQAVSAYSGVEDVQSGRRPRIGLLLGSRRYKSAVAWFALGDRLTVNAYMQLRGDDDLVGFRCEIVRGAETLAQADIKAICPADVHAVLGKRR